MKFLSKTGVKSLLREYQISPSKRLGQNFLVDRGVVKKIIEAANLESRDVVLEIGPGVGNLTIELAKQAGRVVAVEKDPRMCGVLKELLECWNVGNVEIIQGDILKTNIQYLISNIQYKVVANLPFYLTAPVIRKFLECNEALPRYMVLMVQKEVAQRICAKVPDMNLLAVSVQFYAEPRIISYVSKQSFWPQPKVDSAIIRINPLITADRKLINVDLFFRVARAGFSHPRKQLLNNFSEVLKLEKEKVKEWLLENDLKPFQRAEVLTLQDWLNLTKSFKIN